MNQREPRTSAGGASIEFDEVTIRYPGSERPVIDRLSFAIDDGELVVLVGPSGCGKTTTLRLINRLASPTSGTVRIDGDDIAGADPAQLRRNIGYVIQQIGLFPHRSVADNIATVPRLLGWDKARTAARVEELVTLVGLDEGLLGRYPNALSGGQQQRVGVARALAANPSVLLMDEPYSAVDPVVRHHLQDELLALHQRVGTTIVLVTHDVDEAIRLGDRVALFGTHGRIEQFASPDELLSRPATEYVTEFLGEDRQLRRLALVGADTIMTPLVGSAPNGPRVAPNLPVRTVLDRLVGSGQTMAVVERDGEAIGTIELADIEAYLHRDIPGDSASVSEGAPGS